MLYAAKNKPTPCWKCLEPLDPNNTIPLKIYLMIRDQHIMGMNGPVDLNQLAAHPWLDIFKVDNSDREWCLHLVMVGYKAYRKRYSK